MTVSSSSGSHLTAVVKALEEGLKGGNAHATYEEAVQDIPHAFHGAVPPGLPYSPWQLVEHIRITQWDILEFSRDPDHKSPKWPDDYWPKEKKPAHPDDFGRSVDQTIADRKSFIALLHKAGDKLYAPLPHGEGQTLFREAILIIDHTAYHTGELIVLRRLLGIWK